MVHVFTDISVVLLVIPLVVSGLVLFQHVDACPFILGWRKTILFYPLSLFDKRGQCGIDLAFLDHSGYSPCTLALRDHEIIIVVGLSIDKRGIRLMQDVVETLVHDRRADLLDIILHQPGNRTIQVVGQFVVFIEDVKDCVGSLLVLGDRDQRQIIVGNRYLFPFCRVDRCGDIGEHLFDRCLYLIYIYISHDDDRLQVRTIPFLVVSSQFIRFEVFDHVDRADRHPVRVTASRVHLG